jgi:hypothetical protein
MRSAILKSLVLGFLFSSFLHGQDTTWIEEQLLDGIVVESDETADAEQLLWLRKHPMNLNAASAEDLQIIPGVSAQEAEAVISFRDSVRELTTVNQLSTVPGLSVEAARALGAFVVVRQTRSRPPDESFVDSRSRLIRDLQTRKGFKDGTYRGSPLRSYQRVIASSPSAPELGILVDKDAGERSRDGFVSGYVVSHQTGILSQILVGDYVVRSGQGLVFHPRRVPGKWVESVSNGSKLGSEILPHRSSEEHRFHRGIVLASRLPVASGHLSVVGLFSARRYSASVDSIGVVTSIDQSGLVRTKTELGKAGRVGEILVGSRFVCTLSDRWIFGATLHRSTYDSPLRIDPVSRSSVASMTVGGFDVRGRIGPWSVFGEVARSSPGSMAAVVGASIDLGSRGIVKLLYRDYSSQFRNMHSSGFGEHDETSNERGAYVGLKLRSASWLVVRAYADHFKFPKGSGSLLLPTSGSEYACQVDLSVSPPLDISARFSRKSTEEPAGSVDALGRSTQVSQNLNVQRSRLTVTYQATPSIRFKARLERAHVLQSLSRITNQGILLYQDLLWKPQEGLSVESRLIFFRTDSFASRVYEFENDLEGVFTNPPLFGKGRRWYVLARCRATSRIRIALKYSETQKEGVAMLGSGPGLIEGDRDNRVSIQVDLDL